MTEPRVGGGSVTLPARVTTPLLTLITQQSLDEDYQHVADQRASGHKAAATRSPSVTIGALAVFALLVTVAAVQTSRDAGVRNEDRGQLINRIEARRTAVTHLQNELGRLRAANVAADATFQEMGQQLTQTRSRLAVLETLTGFHALSGAGVRATVNDGSGQDQTVRDSDLQLLVNGLFEAGATGVAVNGQRVTALSALRNSGQAIRINDVSLSPPYVVEAVGDPLTLPARFANTVSGVRFRDVTSLYGMPYSMDIVKSLTLPAAPARMQTLRYAGQLGSDPQQQRLIQEEAPP